MTLCAGLVFIKKMKNTQTIEILKKEKVISQEALENLKKWLSGADYKEFWSIIEKMIKEKKFKELNECFYTVIPFGTGGRRGKMGVGPNRINSRTIAESAQGLASYMLKASKNSRKRGVAIAFDNRRNSKKFANICAQVFCGNGIRTYLFSNLRSTPELSFAVRHLKAQAGVVISASHNPPSDNGFKAYWEDGCQVVPPHDKNIIVEVQKAEKIKMTNLKIARGKRTLIKIGKKIDTAYIKSVKDVSLQKNYSAKVVFTPLHGTGFTSALRALKELGAKVYPLKSQMKPDANFTNVYNHAPNPEYPKALESAIEYAKKVKADLVLATDPDADRLGAAYPDKNGIWQTLSGNQIGVLLLNYLLETLSAQKKLSPKNLIVKTYVTTDLISKIAKYYKLRLIDDLLVGFKYIGYVIEQEKNPRDFIFAGEESHGYLFSEACRDKDAGQAAVIFAELVSSLKEENQTVDKYLTGIYQKFGYFKERLYNMIVEGVEGVETVKKIMVKVRQNPPRELAGRKVLKYIDWKDGRVVDMSTNKEIKRLKLAFYGDMVTLIFSEDEFWKITLRPSGTEPKAKFYAAACGEYKEKEKVDNAVEKILAETAVWAKKV